MRAWDLVASSLTALRANPMRSGLTALGVVIGVAAVISMLAIGAGVQKRVEDAIQGLGANLMIVFPGADRRPGTVTQTGVRQNLSEKDVEALQKELTDAAAIAPAIRGQSQIVANGVNWGTQVQGSTPAFFEANDWKIEEGRFFDDREGRTGAKVAVIGATVARELFPNDSPVGQNVRIGSTPMQIIGVMKSKGQSGFGQDRDDTVIIPMSAARRIVGRRSATDAGAVDLIYIEASSAQTLSAVQAQATEILRRSQRVREGTADPFQVRNLTEFAQTQAEATAVFGILLASIAAVSLLVGGIGIMNIMLVSVTERTREIGLRIALGAKRRFVMWQFTLEATLLSVLGGAAGCGLGIGMSKLVEFLTARSPTGQLTALITPESIVLAFSVSAAVGLFFGFWPAARAARLDPIEALRRE